MPDHSFARAWQTVAALAPERIAIVCGERRVTFGEFDERAERLASVLRDANVGPDDKVAIMCINAPEYLEGFFAAQKLGATHIVDSSQVDPVEEIKRICARTYPGADGADVVVEAVGRPETWKQAFYARDLAGTVVLVGVPTPDMKIELPLIDVFGRGGATKSSWYGDCLPSRDFPMLVDLPLQGRLPLDKFVSETIPLDGVEAAFEKMHKGEVLRSVVVF